MDKPVNPIFGKYYVRSRSTALVLGSIDLFLAPFQAFIGKTFPVDPPRSILVSNMGSLGDAVVSTVVIPVLKSAFPEAKIGFLVAKAAAPFLEGHPDVDHVHKMDHWFNRRGTRGTLRDQLATIRQIKARSYDVFLELFPRVQNAIPLAWSLGIPVRIGYVSGGFGSLLTHRLDWEPKRRHVSHWYFDLLRFLPLGESDINKARVTIAGYDHRSFVEKYRKAGGRDGKGHILFHVGCVAENRKWSSAKWRELAIALAAEGEEIIFTGQGRNDDRDVAEVISGGLRSCINLCGHLTMAEYLSAIGTARLVVCVDTVAQHIASGSDTPCVVLVNGIHPYIWYPMHSRHKAMINRVECVPCFRPDACKGLECLNGVQVREVHDAIKELLAGKI